MLQEELKFTVGWDIFLFSGDSEFESGLFFQNIRNKILQLPVKTRQIPLTLTNWPKFLQKR